MHFPRFKAKTNIHPLNGCCGARIIPTRNMQTQFSDTLNYTNKFESILRLRKQISIQRS